jgi:hypothetical protein
MVPGEYKTDEKEIRMDEQLIAGCAVVIVALIALVGFRSWLSHSRRSMIHRERMMAFEKGVELPAVEQEVRHGSWSVQRILILAGLTWISLSIGLFVFLSVLAGGPPVQVPWEALGVTMQIPAGIQWTALAPFGIGLAHLLVYAIGRNKEF